MHNCPICGELTAGTISEGGVHFSVCDECYQGRYQENEQERREDEQKISGLGEKGNLSDAGNA